MEDRAPLSDSSLPPSHRKRKRSFAAGLLTLAVPSLLFLIFLADQHLTRGTVPHGVTLAGRSLAGLAAAEATAAVTARSEKLLAGFLAPHLDNVAFTLRPPEVAFAVDIPATVRRALTLGQQGGRGTQFLAWLRRSVVATELVPIGAVDREVLQQLLDLWEAQGGQAPSAGAVTIHDGQPKAELPRAGIVINRAAAQDRLLDALLRGKTGDITLPMLPRPAPLRPEDVNAALARARHLLGGAVDLHVPGEDRTVRLEASDLTGALRSHFVTTPAPALDLTFDPSEVASLLAPLRGQMEKPPVDATFDIRDPNHVMVVPGHVGTRIDASTAARALLLAAETPERVGTLPLDRGAAPALPTDEAEALGIRHLVASFTTRHAGGEPRVRNIHRIADLLDGVIVRPGATFSVNAWIGPRTAERGFVPAPSIADGEMVETVGGGVSQFATTLFNALIDGGYEVLERQAHSYYFSRYPRGHEATLSYPKPDLVFRNDTTAGLLLRMEYTDTSIRVLIFGDNGGRKVERKVSPDTDFVRPETIYEANDDMKPSEEKILASGAAGWSVTVTRIITFPDGTKKEEQRKVTYHPRERRIAVHSCRIPRGQMGATGKPCSNERRSEEDARRE